MSLVPWKPRKTGKSPFDLESWFNFPMVQWPEWTRESFEGAWTPAIDVVESKTDFRIKADLPGLDKKDVKVTVEGDVLAIKGEKKSETETNEDGVLRKERTEGSFYRSFALPHNVDGGHVKASYKDGVLELTIPKKDEDGEQKSISVDVE